MSTVIGRNFELARIARLAKADRESALLVLGAPGMGKTQFLKAARDASDCESVILQVNPAETHWPFAGLSILLSLLENVRMSDVIAISRSAAHSPTAMFETSSRVLDAVRASTFASSQLVLIDDFDRMDSESKRVISFLAGRLSGTGLRLVVSATDLDPALTFGPVLELGALSRSDALLVAKKLAGPAADEGTLSIIVDHADGNPLAIRESINRLTDGERRGVAALRLPLGATPVFQRSSAHRIAGLTRAKRGLLERLSSVPLMPRALATRGEPQLEDLLQDLIASGLVLQRGKNVRISSGVLRSYVYWSLSSQERRSLHAAELDAITDQTALAAWHASFGSATPPPSRGLLYAAVALVRDNELVAAVEFAERARMITPGGRDDVTGIAALSAALFRNADLLGASRYADVGMSGNPSGSSRLTLARLRLQSEFLRSLRISDLDVDAWADLHERKDPQSTAKLLAIASVCRAVRWEIGPARRLLDRANRLAAAPAQAGVIKAEQLLLAVSGDGDAPTISLRHIENASVVEMLVAARAAIMREHYIDARHLCSVILKFQPAVPIWVDTAQYMLAELELLAEKPFAARAEIARWKSLPSSESRSSFGAQLDAWLAYVDNRTGEAVDIISAELDSPRYEHGPATRAFLYRLRGQIALSEDDVDTAIRMLGHAEAIGKTLDNPGLVRHLPDLVEAYYRAGRLAELTQTIERFEELRRHHPSRWATRASARIAAIAAPDDQTIALFDRAIVAAKLADAGAEAGRLHALRAARLARLDRPAESQRSYLAARDLFDEAGEYAWARRMDERLATIAFQSFPSEENSALSLLTEEEKRIVKYVQLGLRNKEIALALYIAVRTVELRLTHIYRTVGVRSRSQLISTLRH
jgi:DNA-binding CsgD family transcriptional regulator